jgi:tellurite resistance protein TehA-like permease
MRFSEYKPFSINPPIYGTFWRQSTAQVLEGAGILLSLLLGFGYLCFCLAIIGVADVFIRRQASNSLVWWSVVFPTATMTTAWLELGSSMDSPAF